MDNIRALRAFVEVVRYGSFVRAADHLRCSTSSISRLIRDLEDDLGQPLLLRTTRSLTLSTFGERRYQDCLRIIAAVDALHHVADEETRSLSGDLRISTTTSFAQQRLIPLLPEFLDRHPKLRLHWFLNDQRVDLSAQGMDMAIRIANLQDSSMVARRLGRVDIWLVAAPRLLAREGMPTQLADVARMRCTVCTVPQFRNRWPLAPETHVDGPVWADCGEVSREAAIAGLGVGFLPDFMVERAVADGRLIRLFSDQDLASVELSVLYPGRHQINAAASALGDYFAAKLTGDAGEIPSVSGGSLEPESEMWPTCG